MTMDRKRSVRGSVRSRGSSTGSSSEPREKLKDCCRQFVAFMFTQVGVGALVVSYAIMGAFAFQSIEGKATDATVEVENFNVSDLRTSAALRLWNVTDHHNVLNKTKWYADVLHVLFEYQGNMTDAIKKGYDGQSSKERWTFPSALMFSLSVFTMIGFGHLVPRTTEGKVYIKYSAHQNFLSLQADILRFDYDLFYSKRFYSHLSFQMLPTQEKKQPYLIAFTVRILRVVKIFTSHFIFHIKIQSN